MDIRRMNPPSAGNSGQFSLNNTTTFCYMGCSPVKLSTGGERPVFIGAGGLSLPAIPYGGLFLFHRSFRWVSYR
ncbi:hypothetical protein BMS3Abin14_00903 [bacterium BMS3Abin14]|nr:hypothetical protein BMS3Abin14_00903 [bacterium BMS3Abin14]